MARHLHIDPFSGIAGDMLLAGLVDLGASAGFVEEAVRAVRFPGPGVVRLEFLPVSRCGVRGRRLRLELGPGPAPESADYPTVRSAVAAAPLSSPSRERALRILETLGAAEAETHGVALEDVRFRELGGLDTVVDVVGCIAALESLDVAGTTCGPLPLTRGEIRDSEGVLPAPAPATLQLLRGIPTVGLDVEGELVTPTGAALARGLADGFGPPPALTLRASGAGFGSTELPGRPNCVRLLLGDTPAASGTRESLRVLEANLDDLPAEILGTLIEVCLTAGALDAWLTPALMKKGRPGHLLSALCRGEAEAAVTDALFRHSSTLGVRSLSVAREALERTWEEVDTPWGAVRVKIGRRGGEELNRAPEFEDCRRVSSAAGVPLKEVYAATLRRRRS